MSLLFRNCDLRPVLTEAIANQCRVILVKDQGVYWLAEHGERLASHRQKWIAYAVGCNPDVDAFDDWWPLGRDELGGDDFGEHFDPKMKVFKQILDSKDDLLLTASETHLTLEAVRAKSTAR